MGDGSEGTRTITTPAAPLAHHLDSRPFGSPPSLSLDITRVSLLGVKLDECALKTSAALPARRRLPAFKHERCDGAAQAKQPAHLATPNASGSNALVNFGNRPALIPRGGREGGRKQKSFFSSPFCLICVHSAVCELASVCVCACLSSSPVHTRNY